MRVIVAGKGGSGKSTIAALIARLATKRGHRVMLVDADESNPGIERMLGLSDTNSALIDTVGGRIHVFGEVKDTSSEAVQAAVKSVMRSHAENDFFVVRVGKIREAGSGCACPHGAIVREILSYSFESDMLVVVDTEAGVEHFGRGIDARADAIVFVVDPSYDSIRLCQEAKTIAEPFCARFLVVLNKVSSDEVSSFMKAELANIGADVAIVVPYDNSVFMSTMMGRPLEAGAAIASVERLLDEITSAGIAQC